MDREQPPSTPEIKVTPVMCESCGYVLTSYSRNDDRCPCPLCKKRVDLK